MSLMFAPLRRYAQFSGRARRREYWLFILFVALVSALLSAWIASTTGGLPIADAAFEARAQTGLALLAFGLFHLLVFLPAFAVSVRRLHDSGKSGWWLLLNLLPAGALVLIIFYLLDGTPGPNRYGPDPKARPAPRYN